jgi:hypothetical protein
MGAASRWKCGIERAALSNVESIASIPKTICGTMLSRIADHPINRIEELLPWTLFADHR